MQQGMDVSIMGARLRSLWDTCKRVETTEADACDALLKWVDQLIRHAGFSGGTQQDAAECLMHILRAVDQGGMQRRICGAEARLANESIILCPLPDDAKVGHTVTCKYNKLNYNGIQ